MNITLDRFFNALPDYPRSTNNFEHGSYKNRKEEAIYNRYIQHNRNQKIHYLAFDIDYDEAYWAANDALLPPPTIITLNGNNGRGHLLYELKDPITICDEHPKPNLYAKDIHENYTTRLNADTDYTGSITKCPLHSSYRVYTNDSAIYTLADLKDYALPSPSKAKRCKPSSGAYLGRNCQLFEQCRMWAYHAWREASSNRSKFDADVLKWCQDYNTSKFEQPLNFNEVKGIAKSVVKWVWNEFSKEIFSEIQSRRGQRGSEVTARNKRKKKEIEIREAIKKLKASNEKVSQSAVARITSISQQNISKNYKQLFQK